MKTPKIIKGTQIIKVLMKRGYRIKSRKGSHVSLSNDQIHITVVLPVTTIGVFKKICRTTGINQEEFL